MLKAYLSLDPVNTERFLELAGAGPDEVRTLEPRDELPDGLAMVLVDWDTLPAVWRRELVKELRARANAPKVVVHSYHVADGDRQDLCQLGVPVYRTLAEAV